MSQKIIVNKFGGGILKKEFFPLIKKRIEEQIQAGFQPILVVSALPGITDELLNNSQQKNFLNKFKQKHFQTLIDLGLSQKSQIKAKSDLEKIFIKLEKDLKHKKINSPCFEDQKIAYGEKLSAIIMAHYLNTQNLKSKIFFAEDISIITDDNFKNANILLPISRKNVVKIFSNLKEIAIIPGFTGKTSKGQTTTLGRGGTDTTACFIGSILRAEKIILWKDVGGVLSADPKIVSEAQTIPVISYQEAEEAGKIIHEKAIQYPKLFKMKIEIASLVNPKLKTEIKELKNNKKGAKLVSFKRNLTLFLITDEKTKGVDLLSIVSQAFYKNKVDIILISNTRYSLQIVAENNNGLTEKVLTELKKKVEKIEIYPVSMVYLVGNFNVQDVNNFNSLLIEMKTDMEISAFLYKNCTRIEAVIKTKKLAEVVQALYKRFIKNKSR